MHVPVLAEAALAWLRPKPGGVYIDCTAGAGGHSILIAERMGEGRLLALDRDRTAVGLVRERLAGFPGAEVLHRNYAELAEAARERGVEAADGILLDAGCSSMQLDEAARGFSFQQTGPLDMRMDAAEGETAADLLRRLGERELATLLKDYGDVRPAARIAGAVKRRSAEGRMETTDDLREAVHEALPFVQGTPQETRTVFQAIRMAVNEELQHLEGALEQAVSLLAPGGRLVVISFHSGEDRVVKNVLRDASRVKRTMAADGRVAHVEAPALKLLTRSPQTPDEDEIQRNPRAASAKLRAAEKLEAKAS